MSTMPEREPSSSGPISIDRTSPVPLYFQLAQHFESAIRSGALKVGARLENEVQLAEMLGLSRPTVRAAFLYLANKGLVVRKRGAGTVVANERIDRNVQLNVEMLEEHGLYELLRASGIGLYSATQRMGAKNASAAEARTLDETRGTALLTMERIAYDQSGRPVEFARHLYRASRYAFTTSFPRPDSALG
jgi:DNA-binding GntR family transcriptional regulator